jgi:hypothetical protein
MPEKRKKVNFHIDAAHMGILILINQDSLLKNGIPEMESAKCIFNTFEASIQLKYVNIILV